MQSRGRVCFTTANNLGCDISRDHGSRRRSRGMRARRVRSCYGRATLRGHGVRASHQRLVVCVRDAGVHVRAAEQQGPSRQTPYFRASACAARTLQHATGQPRVTLSPRQERF